MQIMYLCKFVQFPFQFNFSTWFNPYRQLSGNSSFHIWESRVFWGFCCYLDFSIGISVTRDKHHIFNLGGIREFLFLNIGPMCCCGAKGNLWTTYVFSTQCDFARKSWYDMRHFFRIFSIFSWKNIGTYSELWSKIHVCAFSLKLFWKIQNGFAFLQNRWVFLRY